MNLREKFEKENPEVLVRADAYKLYTEWLEKRDKEREKLLQQKDRVIKQHLEDAGDMSKDIHFLKVELQKERQAKEEFFMDVKSKDFYHLNEMNDFIQKEDERDLIRIKPINIQYVPLDDIDFDNCLYILFYYEEIL